jgi:hypothetical protein
MQTAKPWTFWLEKKRSKMRTGFGEGELYRILVGSVLQRAGLGDGSSAVPSA